MKKLFTVSTLALMLGFAGGASAGYHGPQGANGGFTGPGPGLAVWTVAEVSKLSDDTPVILIGNIEKSLGGEKYLFKDASGSITVEIDDDDWHGLNVNPENVIEIRGEVDKGLFDTKIDAEVVTLKK